jgi:hypothetical protein
MVAAKVECLSIAFGVESGCFVHSHSADGIFGHGFGFIHVHVLSWLFLVVSGLEIDRQQHAAPYVAGMPL